MNTDDPFYMMKSLRDAYGDRYDSSFTPVWKGYWCTYEENGWCYVLEKDGQLYILDYMYSVMSDDNERYWDPYPVTEEEALERMIEWEETYGCLD